MSLSNEVDRALLAIGRRSNRLSSEQMRHHEEVLSKFIAAEDEEDDPFVTDDDNDEDYVPVDDGEVSDIENELGVEEELPENEEIYEVEWDEVIEPEPSVSNLNFVSGVNRLLGEKEQCYECKIDNMFWKKEPPAPRARHWNRFTSTSPRPVGPAHRFLPNPVSIFRDIMSLEIVDIIVRQTNRKAGEMIKAWNEANPTCKPKEWKEYKPAAVLDYNENKSGVDTMDKMLSGYSCKRATNRWPLAIFFNMLDITGLASYIIYKHLRPSKKSDQRRDFILELAEQLTIPLMETRAANPRVYGRPGIKIAMQKFNVFYDRPSTSTAPAQKTASKPVSSQYRPLCKLCTKLDKFKRKPRFTCHICKDAMCLTHGLETKTYTCSICLAAVTTSTS